MKPIVIYPKNNGDNITMTKKEFEKYLQEAYDAGYADGCKTNWVYPTVPTTNPIITWTSTPVKTPNPIEITC